MSEMVEDEPLAGEDIAEGAVAESASVRACSCGGKFWPLVLVVIIIIALWYILGAYTGIPMPGFSKIRPTGDWQAVFLDNGQVYFGKIKNVSSREIVLSDIYYLQVVTKPLQMTQEGATGSTDQTQTQQELTLIKLGNELHGPTDKMVINRDFILLTETLKNDSRVVQAIDKYLQDQNK